MATDLAFLTRPSRSSAPRSSLQEGPVQISHGSGHRLCAARRHSWGHGAQATTQKQRALPVATQGSFVTPGTGLGSYNVAKPYKQASVPIGALKDGGR
jgi:hypothetical protein